jgi:hypothetical protein
MKKRILTLFLTLCVMLSGMAMFTSCSRAPAVEEIYDRVVELVEASYDLNTVFYGAGLPVYKTNSEYAEFTHMYYDFAHKGSYEYVMPRAQFLSEEQIRTAAEKVYSKDYLKKVIYPATFVGYAIDDGMGDAAYAYARYMQEYDSFYQSTQDESYIDGMRIYDYSTIQIINPSNAQIFRITVDTWMESSPEKIEEVTLSFTLAEDGQWYLNTFTG